MQLIKSSSNELTTLIGEQRIATEEITQQLGTIVHEVNNLADIINTTIDEVI